MVNRQLFRQEVKHAAPILYDWLVGRFDGIGLQQLESLFHQQRIFINGQPAHPQAALEPGDVVEIHRRYVAEITPEKHPINILHEDDDLLIVNKPAGMPVHPGLGHYRGTLLHALAQHYLDSHQADALLREGVVHRLDKDTSGILVLAKNLTAKKHLEAQFRYGHMHRIYEALVWGVVATDEGVIDVAVGRVPGETHLLAADPTSSWGKPAITRFKVDVRHGNQTRMSLFPETGRTHQLRIHLHWLGHPIVGDQRYTHNHLPKAPRLQLHAKSLTFLHPQGMQPFRVDCPFILDK